MLDEQEMAALAALLRDLADQVGDDRLSNDARRMARALRERLAGGGRDGVVPGESAEARQDKAAAREQAAERRDHAADLRDLTAEQRDSAAVERGVQAQQGRTAAEAADRAFHDVLWEAELRDQAGGRREDTGEPDGDRGFGVLEQQWHDAREQGRKDRAALRQEWGTVRRERAAAQADEEAAHQDRLQARVDRQAAAADRAAAGHDREAVVADREQADIEHQLVRLPLPEAGDASWGGWQAEFLAGVRDTREDVAASIRRARQIREKAAANCRRARHLKQNIELANDRSAET
ncbi:hypothetical protein AB0I81_29190 [Nonomuraea sp. NPDC050404]|uniref:hypothetical protein n=1 Tax=Nonomuraea sp. NPDC050404 TaxID=3155783 RepID=UPI0033E44D30